MANPIGRIGDMSEQGRGVPLFASRPAAALPFSPLVAQAYAFAPRARMGWGQGTLSVRDVALDAPWSVSPTDTPANIAAALRRDEAGFVPVTQDNRFLGVIYADSLLQCVADNQVPPTVSKLISTQIPTCAPDSAL